MYLYHIQVGTHWEHALYPTLESEPMTKSKFCQHYSSQWVHFYQDYSKLNEIEHFWVPNNAYVSANFAAF